MVKIIKKELNKNSIKDTQKQAIKAKRKVKITYTVNIVTEMPAGDFFEEITKTSDLSAEGCAAEVKDQIQENGFFQFLGDWGFYKDLDEDNVDFTIEIT